MKFCVMQSLPYLTIEGISKTEGLHLDDDYWIGTDLEFAAALASQMLPAAGSLETQQLATTPAYAYVAKRFASGEMEMEDALAYLGHFATKTQMLVLGLWFVKDNSANGGTSYIRHDNGSEPDFLSVARTAVCFTSDCEFRTLNFTREEFDRGVAYYTTLQEVIPKIDVRERRLSGLVHPSRLARTLYHVQAARNTDDLTVKIAFYCMCLESLFSTDKEGITYRIAERTALFVGANGPERRAIFEDVTKLYATRSKVVHGDVVKKGQLSDLIERVKRGDDYLRKALVKILGDEQLRVLFSTKPSEEIGVPPFLGPPIMTGSPA